MSKISRKFDDQWKCLKNTKLVYCIFLAEIRYCFAILQADRSISDLFYSLFDKFSNLYCSISFPFKNFSIFYYTASQFERILNGNRMIFRNIGTKVGFFRLKFGTDFNLKKSEVVLSLFASLARNFTNDIRTY